MLTPHLTALISFQKLFVSIHHGLRGFENVLNFDLPKDAELTRKVVREFAERRLLL